MKRVTVALIVLVIAVPLGLEGQTKFPSKSSSRSVLEAYVAAWNRHDEAGVAELLAKDGVHEDLAQNFRGQGAAQVIEFMRGMLKEEPDFQWRLTNVIESGNRIAAEWTWTATHTGDTPSGPVKNLRISGRGASVAVIENGKVKRFTDYYDNASFYRK